MKVQLVSTCRPIDLLLDLSDTWTALTPFDVLCQGRSRKNKGKRHAASSFKETPGPKTLQGPRFLSPTLVQVKIVRLLSSRAAVSSRHVDGGCSALEANRHTPCQVVWLFSGLLLPHKCAVTIVHAYTRHGQGTVCLAAPQVCTQMACS